MRPGKLLGGKIANPVREMLASEVYNGVIFHCSSPEHAETTRIAALTLKLRNDYQIKTNRKDSDIIVYKNDGIDYPNFFAVDNYKEE